MFLQCHCERSRLGGRAWQSRSINTRLLRHFIPRKDNLFNAFVLVCHSGLDPESSVFLDSCFRRNDALAMTNVAIAGLTCYCRVSYSFDESVVNF